MTKKQIEQAENYLELIKEIDNDEEIEELQTISINGRKIREAIKQLRGEVLTTEEQLLSIFVAVHTDWSKYTLREVVDKRRRFIEYSRKRGKGVKMTNEELQSYISFQEWYISSGLNE